MMLDVDNNGCLKEHKEPFQIVEFPEKEDYERFNEIVQYYNQREERERYVAIKAIKRFEDILCNRISDATTDVVGCTNLIKECSEDFIETEYGKGKIYGYC